jgi:hypothetical protein
MMLTAFFTRFPPAKSFEHILAQFHHIANRLLDQRAKKADIVEQTTAASLNAFLNLSCHIGKYFVDFGEN